MLQALMAIHTHSKRLVCKSIFSVAHKKKKNKIKKRRRNEALIVKREETIYIP